MCALLSSAYDDHTRIGGVDVELVDAINIIDFGWVEPDYWDYDGDFAASLGAGTASSNTDDAPA
jgi:hypothetical protein